MPRGRWLACSTQAAAHLPGWPSCCCLPGLNLLRCALCRLAPELLLGGACTPAVDVWAFGVLCWQLVTGEHPQRGAMRAPRVPEECPQSVADLILECMR